MSTRDSGDAEEGDKRGRDGVSAETRGDTSWGKVPRVNVSEKLILCVEDSEEMRALLLDGDNGSRISAVSASMRCLATFVFLKHRVNSRHSYAVLTTHPLTWIRDLTKDPTEVLTALQDFQRSSPSDDSQELYIEDILQAVGDSHPPPPVAGGDPPLPWAPPPHVTRVVMATTRPPPRRQQAASPLVQSLIESPYFFLDYVLINNTEHPSPPVPLSPRPPSGLCVGASARRPPSLCEGFCRLVAHPLQRPHPRHSSRERPLARTLALPAPLGDAAEVVVVQEG